MMNERNFTPNDWSRASPSCARAGGLCLDALTMRNEINNDTLSNLCRRASRAANAMARTTAKGVA